MMRKKFFSFSITFFSALSFFHNAISDCNAESSDIIGSNEEIQAGDVNCDRLIDGRDAADVLTYYTVISTGGVFSNEKFHKEYADHNKDNIIDGRDAASILTYYAKSSVNPVIPTDLSDGQLVRILDYIPDAVIDLRYASENNFTGKTIYTSDEAYLCFGTVRKLMNVQKQLEEYNLRILIWDAYRPEEAQWTLWNVCPDPNFVADPNYGITSHECGNTVDISLVDGTDGYPLLMPSEFDEFNAHADRDYSDVSAEAASNARLLEDIMLGNGFTGYYGEWWDYSDTVMYTPVFMPDNV